MLLADSFRGHFEQAVIITNDSDLAKPIDVVHSELKLPVVILFLCPGGRTPSYHLSKLVTSSPIVNPTLLAAHQFPNILTDAKGSFYKPVDW